MDQKNVTILIIEDEPLLQAAMSAYFVERGYQTLVAGNGREGLETFFLQRPDAVLLDLRMSETDGLEVLAQVTLESPGTPVVVVSGLEGQQDVIEALRLGAWEYISKPVEDMAILEYRLNRCLERARRLDEQRVYRETLEREVARRVEELAAESRRCLEATEALRESEDRFRLLVENVREVFLVRDLDQDRIVYVSPAYEKVWGRSCASLCEAPESFMESIHPVERARVLPAYRRLCELGESFNEEYRILLPDGELRWIAAKAFRVAEPGQIPWLVTLAEDITPRKQYEEALIEARRTAESASLAKSEFLANMSHELRTPLNGVLGMLQLLQYTKLEKEQRESVAMALDSSRSLIKIINDILDLTKIEAGVVALRDEEFCLEECMETVVRSLGIDAKRKGLVIETTIDAAVPRRLLGDAGRIRQVLFNLVGNAVKFTEGGSVRLEVYSLPARGRNVRMLFTVSDTGIGIREEDLDTIFEPFKQLDGSLTRRYGGTGLGLGIVRRLVAAMEGHISVESEQGQGTCFHFTIKVRRPAAEKPLIFAPSGGATLSGVPRKVLIVEDDPVNMIALRRIVEKLGHVASYAENGQQGLETLSQGDFDAVLMDIQMPVMDGLEATAAIRASDSPQIRSIPIVALTAHAMRGDRERFLRAGMDDYLAKPVDLQELALTLEKMFRK